MGTMGLYEMTAEIEILEAEIDRHSMENDGEIPEDLEARLIDLGGQREAKLLNLACWVKNLRAESDAIREEESRLRDRRHGIENKAERLLAFLADQIGETEKMSDGRVRISHRRSDAVIITNLTDLPQDCLRYPDPEPRKDEIKRRIKGGTIFSGARLEERNNLVIQ